MATRGAAPSVSVPVLMVMMRFAAAVLKCFSSFVALRLRPIKSVVLTSWFPVLAGDLSVQLPVRPAAHRADLLQAAVMEEATPDEDVYGAR